MKQFFTIGIVLLLFSCGNDPAPETVEKKTSRFEQILNKYKEISFDTLNVYSTFEDPDTDSYYFRGVLFDTTELVFIPKTLDHYDCTYYACYKFAIDSATTGLITRCPGEYSATVLKLFVFDQLKDSVTATYFLADNFGDAGEVMITTSWLLNPKPEGFSFFTYYESEYQHSVENENDTTIDRCYSASYYVLKNGIPDTTEISDPEIIASFRKFNPSLK